MSRYIKIQFFVLLAGTIFAWGNFSLELAAWIKNQQCLMSCAALAPTLF